MTIIEFLSHIRRSGVKLWIKEDRLHYQAPAGVLNPALKAQLIERKSEIIEFLRRVERGTDSEKPTIFPVSREQNLPLSSAQERLWFLHQFDPDSAVYNVQMAFRLTGTLNMIALEKSLNEIVRRHEILRTNFAIGAEQAVQIIHQHIKVQIPVISLQHLSEKERQTEAQHILVEEVNHFFDLAHEPLLRIILIRLGNESHILLLVMHHIIFDGWSADVLSRELSILYEAFCTDKPSPLPELPLQYADFASWQRQQLSGELFETQLAYWTQKLGGNLPVLRIPVSKRRPPVQSFQGASHSFIIPEPLTESFRTLSQQKGMTLFMTLLAVFKILLYRYTQQEDIVVGTPVANRNLIELEGLIGFFVNTLVLRTDLSGNPTFLELLTRVQHVALDAYMHQDLPFEKVVEVLQPERNLSYTPLFQVLFVFQNTPLTPLRLPGLVTTPVSVERHTAKFDLSLIITRAEHEFTGKLEYNIDLFDKETIARMTRHYQNLLRGVAINPNQRITEVPLLTQTEHYQLLVEWNNTKREYPADVCIHQLFEAQVEKTPDAIAVVFEEQQLTYRELNRKANQLAHSLHKLGVGPEVLVGLCLERSLEMVVAMFGVLKAGGAYVPVDPDYPAHRVAFMLKNSHCQAVLTLGKFVTDLHEYKLPIICLDRDWDTICLECDQNPEKTVTPENLAYVIYTSGSTGEPKGVMIPHRGICNHMLWMQHTFPLTTADTVLQKTPFSFDASVWEFYAPLQQGARLLMARPGGHLDPEYLIKTIRKHHVTTLQLVPSLLRMLLQHKGFMSCPSLTRVFCGGEALPVELQEPFLNNPQTMLYNLYGPTEASIDASWWHCRPLQDQSIAPIGRPIANTQYYILDQHLQPVSPGVPGELHIGGAGLARGYLNQPELTAKMFIPYPFHDHPGTVLYKTGDLAQFMPDGNVEFLGRIDHQVKIRGFRIELGEIEATLADYPAVSDVIVIAREDQPEQKRLVAYIVPTRNPVPSPKELSEFLAEKLPEYMIPSAFVVLDEFPLTPGGKIDRRALPEPQKTHTRSTTPYISPRNEVERQIVKIWQEILHLEHIGIHDNFFELGGHSLLTPLLMFRMREIFHKEFSLRKFFANPTIAGLAKYRPETEVLNPDLETEIVLNFALPQKSEYELQAMETHSENAAIFLTGATGFVGAFLLYELLQQTQADMHCLVRAIDLEAGRQRIQYQLEAYALWKEEFNARIIPVKGELAQPYLGLSKKEFQLLAERLTCIYHCGSFVNFMYPYHQLKPSNVLGTHEILKLSAYRTPAIPVHYISTTSVFSASSYHDGRYIQEDEIPEHSDELRSGYAQSKWVAERLVLAARDRGLPVCIYRLGTVAGHSDTGMWNTNDYVCRFIKGCIQLGSLPEQNKTWRLTPVDFVSRAVVYLSQQQASLGKVFHVVSPNCFHQNQLADWIRTFGYELQLYPYDQWLTRLVKDVRYSPDHVLYPLIPLFEEEKEFLERKELLFDRRNLEDGLIGTDIVCSPVDRELLSTYFSYFIRSGFLKIPPPGGEWEHILYEKMKKI